MYGLLMIVIVNIVSVTVRGGWIFCVVCILLLAGVWKPVSDTMAKRRYELTPRDNGTGQAQDKSEDWNQSSLVLSMPYMGRLWLAQQSLGLLVCNLSLLKVSRSQPSCGLSRADEKICSESST